MIRNALHWSGTPALSDTLYGRLRFIDQLSRHYVEAGT